MAERKAIGEVLHYYAEIKVAVVKFKRKVLSGEELYFKGATTDFKQKADSMQFDHKAIKEAPKGKEVGLKVKEKVRTGDKVFE